MLRAEVVLLIEKKIYYNVKQTHIKGFEFDDLCQELRMRIYPKIEEIIDSLDTLKNPEGYIATLVKWRLKDIWRKYSKSEDVYYSPNCQICSILPNDQDD